METIIVKLKNKKSLPFLKHLLNSLNEVEEIEVVTIPNNLVAKNIYQGLKETKVILSGKKKAKTLDQLLNED
jgi:hypothetical protein